MKKHMNLLRLLLMIFWIAFIFSRSLKPGSLSSADSKHWLSILLSILPFPISELFLRKMAHFAEFFVLGTLSGGLFFTPERHLLRQAVPSSILVCFVTALNDETIQLFVEGRSGNVTDVWIDMAGALCGLLLVLLIAYLRRKWKLKKTASEQA